MRKKIQTAGILFGTFFVVGICAFTALNTPTFTEKRAKAVEVDDIQKPGTQEKKVLSTEEKNKEIIKILDPDGTLGLKIVEEGEAEDGEYTIVTRSYEVDSEEKNKILWERLQKYHKQLDMLEGNIDENAVGEAGTPERID